MEVFRLKLNVFLPFPWIVNLQKSTQINKENSEFFTTFFIGKCW